MDLKLPGGPKPHNLSSFGVRPAWSIFATNEKLQLITNWTEEKKHKGKGTLRSTGDTTFRPATRGNPSKLSSSVPM